MKAPLCVDLFCGLGGWSDGFIAEGWDVIGFDIERHVYGDQRYPGQLVLQDCRTLHGSQFRNADCLVASPPCQKYSWLAMPWSRSKSNHSQAAKALRHQWETEGPDNRLFDACFRIQKEAIAATGYTCVRCEGAGYDPEYWVEHRCALCSGTGRQGTRHIPLVVENVRGAIPWVGRSAWNYGSFHLWGDVPALMPISLKRGSKVPGFRFDGSGGSFQTASVDHTKNNGGCKTSWFFGTRADPRDVRLVDGVATLVDGTKIGGDWFSDPKSTCRKHGSRSQARKAASAQIAKIPFELARHIAAVYKPRQQEVHV